ncbi:F-box domain-containing protein [Mycena chlorophos]|uniref:F-box domain-containing protein n=1 Tax=Mycena chlorophos TaxID=658473 RepID=A0A8H6VWG3_MYCCL|nr:F-box domain-containing protein [Mycena chlorophos]
MDVVASPLSSRLATWGRTCGLSRHATAMDPEDYISCIVATETNFVLTRDPGPPASPQVPTGADASNCWTEAEKEWSRHEAEMNHFGWLQAGDRYLAGASIMQRVLVLASLGLFLASTLPCPRHTGAANGQSTVRGEVLQATSVNGASAAFLAIGQVKWTSLKGAKRGKTRRQLPMLCLPVELVLETLQGASIVDLASVSHTAGYLRTITLAHRSLWLSASETYKLVLPPGQTLHTVDLPEMLRSAARSASIARKLTNPDAASALSLHTVEMRHLYYLPSYAFWSPPRHEAFSFLPRFPPPILDVLPGGHAFIMGDVEHLAVYDIQPEGGLIEELPPPKYVHQMTAREVRSVEDVRRRVSWDSLDNGARIVLAVVSSGYAQTGVLERNLTVFILTYPAPLTETNTNTKPSRPRPTIERIRDVLLPIEANAVCVNGDRILVSSRDTFMVFEVAKSEAEAECRHDVDVVFTAAGDTAVLAGKQDCVSILGSPQRLDRLDAWPWTSGELSASGAKTVHSNVVVPVVASAPTVTLPEEIPGDEGCRVVRMDSVYGIALVFVKGKLWSVRY